MFFNCLSLFSSVGIAETYFEKNGFNVLISNELLIERAKLYSILYPKSEMIIGNINDNKIYNSIITKSKEKRVNFIIATPPCQGMSTAGKKLKFDERNKLIIPTVNAILDLMPDFVIIENVAQVVNTLIKVDNRIITIPNYLHSKLDPYYNFNEKFIVNAMHYGVPQSRERCIYLLSKKKYNIKWEFPLENTPITMKEAIGGLPSLDPLVTDIDEKTQRKLFPDFLKKAKEGVKVSFWHTPPKHKLRHVIAMMHTPEGHSAWENNFFFPKLKNGQRSKGYKNTYKRQWWTKPAYTITRYTSRLGSQENGHPGRILKNDGTEKGRLYSDPRTMTIYELMLLSSLPKDWKVPNNTSSNLIREAIGEGVPPKLIEAALLSLKKLLKD
jgi:DNA (cytosine-5)-methyltransferase 1